MDDRSGFYGTGWIAAVTIVGTLVLLVIAGNYEAIRANQLWIEILIGSIILGLIPALIARSKGHSLAIWWVYGALIFIVALVHSLILRPDTKALEKQQLSTGMVKCPHCAEIIKPEAKVCKHCGRDVG